MTVIPFYSYHQQLQTQFQPEYCFYFLSVTKLHVSILHTDNNLALCTKQYAKVKKKNVYFVIHQDCEIS